MPPLLLPNLSPKSGERFQLGLKAEDAMFEYRLSELAAKFSGDELQQRIKGLKQSMGNRKIALRRRFYPNIDKATWREAQQRDIDAKASMVEAAIASSAARGDAATGNTRSGDGLANMIAEMDLSESIAPDAPRKRRRMDG